MTLHVVKHPVIEDVMTRLRDERTPPGEFRRLARRVSLLLTAEATRDLPLQTVEVVTPLEKTETKQLASRIVAVPVLRAGLGMLDAFLELVPRTEVGYFGLERNEETAEPRRYYEKVPDKLGAAVVFLLDPMLATGGSATLALDGLKDLGAERIRLLSIVAAPEGVAQIEKAVPDATVYTAALDRELNHKKYIVPGLGDFGDRLYGT